MKPNTILLISLSTVAANALPEQIASCVRSVGLREAREVSFYIIADEANGNEAFVEAHMNYSKPASRFAVLFLSVRWSRTQGDYVMTSNKFANLDEELVGAAWAAATEGLLDGKRAWEEANAESIKLETLSARILVESASTWSQTAYFAEREDAELWATQRVGIRNVDWVVTYLEASLLSVNSLQSEVCEKLKLPGLWRAYVSNIEKTPVFEDKVPDYHAEINGGNTLADIE